MKLKISVIFVSVFITIQAALADTVNESTVTTFEDGTPAVADEVNAIPRH